MVQKHTELGQQLSERAVALGVAVPAEMSSTEKATFARLSALIVEGRVVALRKNLVDRRPAKQAKDW